ncbi:hypothetical protein Hdeb2414_s0015g00447881 [Helianthus debilis subsp. tardiflorus]
MATPRWILTTAAADAGDGENGGGALSLIISRCPRQPATADATAQLVLYRSVFVDLVAAQVRVPVQDAQEASECGQYCSDVRVNLGQRLGQ